MEHDIEKIFRDKIVSAERNPVRWNKEQTWNVVEMHLVRNRKITPYFYAAASVVLITLMAGGFQLNDTIPKADLIEIKSSSKNASTKSILSTELKCDVEDAQHIQHLTSPKTPELVTIIVEQKNHPIDSIVKKITVSETSGTALLTLTEPAEESIQQVEPIIGVILPEQSKTSDITVKKTKLRFLRSPEKNTHEPFDHEMKTIFARIN